MIILFIIIMILPLIALPIIIAASMTTGYKYKHAKIEKEDAKNYSK